jgi:hypothetical protein
MRRTCGQPSRREATCPTSRRQDAAGAKTVIEQGFLAACKRPGRPKNDHHFNGGARRGMMGLFAAGKRGPATLPRSSRKTATHRP